LTRSFPQRGKFPQFARNPPLLNVGSALLARFRSENLLNRVGMAVALGQANA
jgi:hypothetical protein